MKTVLILSSTRCLRQTGTSTCFFPYWDVQILQMKKKDWFTLCNFCRVHQDSPLISLIIISQTLPLSLILLFPTVRIRHGHYRKFGKFRKIEGKLTFPRSWHLEITVVTFQWIFLLYIFASLKKKQKQNCHCTGNTEICLFFFFSFSRKRFIAGLSKENRDSRQWGLAHHPKTPNSLKGFTKPFFFFNWRIIAL